MSAHDLVTAVLVYLTIGSLVWVVLDGLGIIVAGFTACSGQPRRAMVLASLMLIIGWPWFVVCLVRGLRGERS